MPLLVTFSGQKVNVPTPVSIGLDEVAARRHCSCSGYSYYADGSLVARVVEALTANPEVTAGRHQMTYLLRLVDGDAAGFFDPTGAPAKWVDIIIWETTALSARDQAKYRGVWGVVVGMRANTYYRPGHGAHGTRHAI